jgi:predicted nucleic acid-binding Zn ribbon protein
VSGEPVPDDPSGELSPESASTSTAFCGQPELAASGEPRSGPGDLAADALASARAISRRDGGGSGRGGSTGGPGASRYRRRRRPDGPTYSGAGADGRDPARIGAIVAQSLPELGWLAPLAEARLIAQWDLVVGADIAARCQAVALTDGTLKIVAESTAWATQLRLMTSQIIDRIASEFGRELVRRLAISGPSGPSWKRGPWAVRGRGVRDTYG